MHVTALYFLGARNHPARLALTGDGGDFTYLRFRNLLIGSRDASPQPDWASGTSSLS